MGMGRMGAMGALWGIVTGSLLLAGCAGYCITDEATGKEGYVFYQPYPYLLVSPQVTSGKVTAYTGEIIYLPNFSRPMRVRAWSGFGKGDFAFKFTDGWMLTSIEADMDNSEVLKQFASLIPDPTKLLGPEDEPAEVDVAKLYRIDFDHRGRACGLTQVSLTLLDESKRACVGTTK